MNNIKKVLFLFNPSSGKRKVLKNIDFIEKELIAKYGSCDIVKSKSKEHFMSTIFEASKTYDYVFFAGGDGTFNMAINSIPDIDDLPIYGYLPCGSTNDMSYNLNISKDIKKGIFDILNAKEKEYSIGQIASTKFIYTCVFGAFVEVCNKTPATLKNRFGTLGYIIYLIKYFKYFFKRNYKLFDITINGTIYKTAFVIISNSKEVSGIRINPFTKEGNDKYYICILNDGLCHGLFNLLYLMRNGVDKAREFKKITYLESDKFTLYADNKECWDVDGESCDVDFPCICGFSGKKIKVLSNRD